MCSLAFRGFFFREIQGQQWISALHLLLGEESEDVTPGGMGWFSSGGVVAYTLEDYLRSQWLTF